LALRSGLLSSVSPKKLLFWSAPLIWVGCGGGGGTDVPVPALSVTTTTAGVDVDPDGYSLSVDGGQAQPIGVNATIVVDQLSDGPHSLGLNGLAANCVAAGENPRTVTVRAGATATADFAVSCSASTGTIEVLATATGSGSDPDGFVVLLDGADSGPITSGLAADFSQIPPGSHTVGLSGLAANCQVVGDNPRDVTVSAGQTAQVPFAVTCTTPGPSSGTLQISTTTGGTDQDPDGYSVRIDQASPQPIAVNATLTLINLSAAAHSVRLLGVAANCSVSSPNPAQVSVPDGGTTSVTFSVTCTPNSATTGGIQVTVATTGSSPDPDGYSVTIDGGTGQPIDVNGSSIITNLTPGSHSVQLGGVAGNCSVGGDNPRSVAVTAGQNAAVAFAVACPTPAPGTGSIRITAATTGTSPDPDGYTVRVDGGNAQPLDVNGSRTIDGLEPRAHTVELGGVAQNCTVTGDSRRTINVTASQTTRVSFAVSCASTAPSLNLRIERISITQSTQRPADDVPLVQGRDAFLRVFVIANGSNRTRPSVRVRAFHQGASTPISTLTIQGGEGSTPTDVQEGNLASSWHTRVEGALIQPGLSLLVDVDPDNALPETNEGDNSYPASGAPQTLSVRAVPAANIMFVPVQQGADPSSVGDVNNGNKDQLMEYARRVYPLQDIQTAVHGVYSTTATDPLTPDQTAWQNVVDELNALRLMEGGNQTYVGITHLNYNVGLVGLAYPEIPVALTWDDPADVTRAVAHELGHTWGRFHSPCGGPQNIDPNYPYPGGTIGVYGYDVRSDALKPPSSPDIMSYCPAPWISDYTYEGVLRFRSTHAAVAAVTGPPQPSLLLWGRIVNGQPVLEPVFQVVARPSLPSRPGPYTIEGSSTDGTRLFGFSFDAVALADGPQSSQHFAFMLPLDPVRADQLGGVRVTGPGGRTSARTAAAAAPNLRGPSADEVSVQAESQAIRVRWNASTHPMIVVRDPDTGEVLSFARGGDVRVRSEKRLVDLEVSDGTHSYRVRRAISR
jgi:hypothetical protein